VSVARWWVGQGEAVPHPPETARPGKELPSVITPYQSIIFLFRTCEEQGNPGVRRVEATARAASQTGVK
jgi:hypothetical protein